MPQKIEVKNMKKNPGMFRDVSLNDVERYFLSALLVDENKKDIQHAVDVDQDDEVSTTSTENSDIRLSDEMLFSLPTKKNPIWNRDSESEDDDPDTTSAELKTKNNISSYFKYNCSLWKAHEDGVHPEKLRSLYSEITRQSKANETEPLLSTEGKSNDDLEDDEEESVCTNEEVRGDENSKDSIGSWSSNKPENYDAWELLKDEYAEDFGFLYMDGKGDKALRLADDDVDIYNSVSTPVFRILGTSADDASAHPHVLSPPLMESLLNFVPDTLSQENLWLKFSLVRDGASLQTLRQYTRGSENTILAILTSNGDVFGSFTSSAWRKHRGYYGDGQAFVWKMSQSRLTPCSSLLEQATLESDILVYPFSGLNNYIQLCTSNSLAVGGGVLDISSKNQMDESSEKEEENNKSESHQRNFGFGIMIDSDLSNGSSSPCATFRSPCLLNDSLEKNNGDVFDILNLEVWTFTPCFNIEEAENMEYKKYLIQKNLEQHANGEKTELKGDELTQKQFYRRVGQDYEDFCDVFDGVNSDLQGIGAPSHAI